MVAEDLTDPVESVAAGRFGFLRDAWPVLRAT
jgi:hypothetical protein